MKVFAALFVSLLCATQLVSCSVIDYKLNPDEIEIEDVEQSIGLKNCTPNFCCPVNLKCSHDYVCLNDMDRPVQQMVKCKLVI